MRKLSTDAEIYIPRRLVVDKGTSQERCISEDEIPLFSFPIVLVGEPGLGKTKLAEALATRLQVPMFSAGHFVRNKNLYKLRPPQGKPLIVDGLDEVTVVAGGSIVAEVLSKLSELDSPPCILSCRAADWEGPVARHQIWEDYGQTPTVLHLQPFSELDAETYLSAILGHSEAKRFLDVIIERRLTDLIGNPFTLKLLGEVANSGKELPNSRLNLFTEACSLLLDDPNPAHQRKGAAALSEGTLLRAAGAIFAHLLLSGSVGVALTSKQAAPAGYVFHGEITDLDVAGVVEVLNTRLFRSEGESLLVPMHRLIAEFLAAQWIAARIDNGFSERRLFQFIQTPGGVLSALRGVHAWLAHFCPRITGRCIKTDPYGILRYGEVGHFTVEQLRKLIHSLSDLAEEDPYFRSEDWDVRSAQAIARHELQDDILRLVTAERRPFHLSTLLLEAIKGSQLSRDLAAGVLDVFRSPTAIYRERHHALEALVTGTEAINWPAEIRLLVDSQQTDSHRLAVSAILELRGQDLDGALIADALIALHGLGRVREDNISGVDYMLPKTLSVERIRDTLDALADRIEHANRETRLHLNNSMVNIIIRFVEKLLSTSITPTPGQIWSWLRHLDSIEQHISYSPSLIQDYFLKNETVRREVQAIAFTAPNFGKTPWIAIVHDLPQLNAGLALSAADAVYHLHGISTKAELSNYDVAFWSDLVRARMGRDRTLLDEVRSEVELGITKHGVLDGIWEELNRPLTHDWEKEHEASKKKWESRQVREFCKHRKKFRGIIDQIRSGENLGAIHSLALAYHGHYSDLNSESSPRERLEMWLGKEIADAALEGFVAVLSRSDLPTLDQIALLHAEGKSWNPELPMICGVKEMAQCSGALSTMSAQTQQSVLAAQWYYPANFDEATQGELEDLIFTDDGVTADILCRLMEPHFRTSADYIPGLYRLDQEARFQRVAGASAIRWLREFPSVSAKIQMDLIDIALNWSSKAAVRQLISDNSEYIESLPAPQSAVWVAAGLIVEAHGFDGLARDAIIRDKGFIWSLNKFMFPDRAHRRPQKQPGIAVLEFVIAEFVLLWPSAKTPTSGWVGEQPWEATRFISNCINALGADKSADASAALDRLAEMPANDYSDQIKHARAEQRKTRRDCEYVHPSFSEVKSCLAAGLPETIDDLKAFTLDQLEATQKYIRDGDTDAWSCFWDGGLPLDEETSRNRLLDYLRPKMGVQIAANPESTMPERKRVDILVIYSGMAIPVEIKGQWHPDVWNAATVQLDRKYTRDYRTEGRGIYLVLWFGEVPKKQLRHPPGSEPVPTNPEELRTMLEHRLTAAERARINVFVLDVSRSY